MGAGDIDDGGGGDEAVWRRRDALNRLAAAQVVAVRTAAGFHGSGFLAADDTVLTCAHVVHGREGLRVVGRDGRSAEVAQVRMVPEHRGTGLVHDFPDLAELRLREPLPGIGVWLGGASDDNGGHGDDAGGAGYADDTAGAPPPGSEVAAHGFSGETLETGVQPDTLHLVVAGASGRFVRVQQDRVVPGFSGGPVLDLRTGRVCGVLKASRDEHDAQGGWVIPVGAVRRHFPQLAARNDRAHRPGTAWCDLALDRPRRQSALFGRFGAAGRDRRRGAARVTPSQLLAHGAMPFVDRPELGRLRAWCDDDADQLLRLLHAPGGSGKTRLAAELCGWAYDQGWIAGFADKGAPATARWRNGLTDALAAGIPVLVVFDYAQARLDDICALLDHVYAQGPDRMRLRVLLLARSDEPLWQALRRRVDDWALAGASVVQLPRTIGEGGGTDVTGVADAADATDATGTRSGSGTNSASGALARSAFTVFADRLGSGRLTPPDLLAARAAREESLLGVLALALDAVLTLRQGGTWSAADDPLERVCDHELRGWHALLAARLPGEAALSGESGQARAEGLLLVPTLAPGRADLAELLARVHAAAFPGQPAPHMVGVDACLRMLYPAADGRPAGTVAALEPDRIGEILVRRVISTPESSGHTAGYLAALLDTRRLAAPADRIAAAAETVEVLARARGATAVGRVEAHPAHPALDAALAQAVAADPGVLLPALASVGAVLPHAEPLAAVMLPALADCAPPVLAAVESRLPDYSSSMSPVAVRVLGRLLNPDGTGDGEPGNTAQGTAEGTAGSTTGLGGTSTGRAVFTAEDQLLRLRRLARYSLRLDDTGRGEEALTAARQAVALSRDLVDRSGRHLADYAAALSNLSLLLHRAGRTEAALEQSRSAVARYQDLLAAAGPADRAREAYLLDTAAALSTLALLRLEDGQVHAAAEEAAQGVLLCDRARPGARRDDTMLTCVEVLAESRQRTGLLDAAVSSGAEAVALLRELTERQPARYLARLPEALHRHARGLLRAGRYQGAYLAMREAATLRAALPGRDPERTAQQRRSLRTLIELSGELDDFGLEREGWLHELASLGDDGPGARPTGGPSSSW